MKEKTSLFGNLFNVNRQNEMNGLVMRINAKEKEIKQIKNII